MNQFLSKNYFTMPNEIFSLGLDASEIAVYAYLRCLENRSSYQCWPSYTTIGNAVGRAKNTVMRIGDRSHLYRADLCADAFRHQEERQPALHHPADP